jgi:hypothetical protein
MSPPAPSSAILTVEVEQMVYAVSAPSAAATTSTGLERIKDGHSGKDVAHDDGSVEHPAVEVLLHGIDAIRHDGRNSTQDSTSCQYDGTK